MRIIVLFLGTIFLMSCAKPLAKFDYQQAQKVAPAKINFTNTSENAETYSWDFGDGNTSTEANPSHYYLLSGSYDVVLTAMMGSKKKLSRQKIVIEAPKECLVAMETSMGMMIFELSDLTPKHRDNFLKLAEENYYDDLLFHRVINGFMAQGGDPKSKNAQKGARLGTGGPGYQIDNEINPALVHVKGALAAAREGDRTNPQKASSGSQFYIVHGKPVRVKDLEKFELKSGFEYTEESKMQYQKMGGTPFLDMGYTVYGQLVEGWDVLDKIAQTGTDAADRPNEDVVIKKVTIIK